MIELGDLEIETLKRHNDRVQRLGFEIEPFGDQAYLIRAYPSIVRIARGADGKTLLRELLAELHSSTKSIAFQALVDRVLANRACRQAVKFGDQLKFAEVERLLMDLDETPGAGSCPHGRPVYHIMSSQQLAGIFKRH